jgi:hypothetical protein
VGSSNEKVLCSENIDLEGLKNFLAFIVLEYKKIAYIWENIMKVKRWISRLFTDVNAYNNPGYKNATYMKMMVMETK